MARIVGPLTACAALGLALLLGTASRSAAAPVGPTGHTWVECWDARSACNNSCLDDYGFCLPAAPQAICKYSLDTCYDSCNRDYDACNPYASARSRKADELRVFVGLFDAIVRSSVTSRTPAQSDLVPLPTPASTGPEGFCRRNDQGQLLVTIYNQGGVPTAATKTRVVFANASSADVDTPAITAGSSTEVVISIPGACFNASNNCSFTVGADSTALAPESNETNNNAAGLCGPQFF